MTDASLSQIRDPQSGFLISALVALAALALLIAANHTVLLGFLLLLGAGLGAVLYHAAFGFASSWRLLLVEGRGEGIRAQMLMLALASAVFLPLLAEGQVFGRPISGAVAPVGWSVAIGAFLFGIGMQLGGACASGTLYSLGGGASRMIVTLSFFMLGSLLGSMHLPWWLDLPRIGSFSLSQSLGWPMALLAQWLVFGAIVVASLFWQRYRAPITRPAPVLPATGVRRLLQGPWPLIAGAVALAILNIVTLVTAGHPWTVSFGYTLWGAKIAQGLGLDLSQWSFWTWRYPSKALAGSVFANTTSVMNFGIILGAFLAATVAGRFHPNMRLPLRSILAAAIGGILMGYGARLAFGCNVGAYFSGIASGSLHGWLWLLTALPGTLLGAYLRPYFGLARGSS